MARRGDQLKEHILWAAKDVFLGLGFERASMDEVAARAQTSKRSLYAHFENKEKLFLAVIGLVRRLSRERLGSPADYSQQPGEALTQFCARYLESLLYRPSIQMTRMVMAQAERFPEAAAQYYDVQFAEVDALLAAYLKAQFRVAPRAAEDCARRLLRQISQPRLTRTLLGLDLPIMNLGADGVAPDIAIKPIRAEVADMIASLEPR